MRSLDHRPIGLNQDLLKPHDDVVEDGLFKEPPLQEKQGPEAEALELEPEFRRTREHFAARHAAGQQSLLYLASEEIAHGLNGPAHGLSEDPQNSGETLVAEPESAGFGHDLHKFDIVVAHGSAALKFRQSHGIPKTPDPLE
ncbi:hypothetical protein MGN01_20470 [Methylobacterium gnaphalii]|uniref:Uncharacterized protein n=1 Tax=Methylobacterium gnaphalii TaxID=1010610 RepID=A0A512JK12_9HYPH|nr:hypothetical protein MGN01_20470 [Methylobacterium gnaphalii]GLS48719.1 hypothetical protein GCM10007885_15630 [Methylobacterium gnaphalii]